MQFASFNETKSAQQGRNTTAAPNAFGLNRAKTPEYREVIGDAASQEPDLSGGTEIQARMEFFLSPTWTTGPQEFADFLKVEADLTHIEVVAAPASAYLANFRIFKVQLDGRDGPFSKQVARILPPIGVRQACWIAAGYPVRSGGLYLQRGDCLYAQFLLSPLTTGRIIRSYGYDDVDERSPPLQFCSHVDADGNTDVPPGVCTPTVWLAGVPGAGANPDADAEGSAAMGTSGSLPTLRGTQAPLANAAPIALFHHAGSALLLSDNATNGFGPAIFEAESQWSGRDLTFGVGRPNAIGVLGEGHVVRNMEYRTRNHDGTTGSGSLEWGLQVAGPARQYVTVVQGEYRRSVPIGAVRLEGWDLLRADTPGKSCKAVVSAASNYRHVTEQTLRSDMWPIIDAATGGACYTRFWLKFWLDWIGTQTCAAYQAAGIPVVTGPAPALPAIIELENQAANSDTTFVCNNLEAICRGDVFIHDSSVQSVRNPAYAAFVHRFAASWPREERSIGADPAQVLFVDQVNIPGCGALGWLNGSRGNMGAGVWPAQISARQMAGLARTFLAQTGSHTDCVTGYELASAMAYADPYANVFRGRYAAGEDAPVVKFLGRGMELPLCGDCSLPAYTQPFYTLYEGPHVANDLLLLRPHVLMQETVYLHTALSQAHAIARLVSSLTCDMLLEGYRNVQYCELTRKQGARHEISPFDRMVANVCAHIFGFLPHTLLMTGLSLSAGSLGLEGLGGGPIIYRPQWIPQQWLGYEIVEVMLMMPEGWAISGPGARFQCDPSKGSPAMDRGLSTRFVRLFRSLPVLDEYQWLGDGGQARGAAHICSGQGAHYTVAERGCWTKPYLSEPPTAPAYFPIDWVDQQRAPGLIVPGQFPVWNDTEENNQAWGLRFGENLRSHELLAVLRREPDRTRTYTFEARNGFLADDPTRVARKLPEIRLYNVFRGGVEPGTPVATIERPTPQGTECVTQGELIAEANSMSDFVAGAGNEGHYLKPGSSAARSPPASRGGRGRNSKAWRVKGGAARGKGVVAFRMKGAEGKVERGVSTANAYNALADTVERPGAADARTVNIQSGAGHSDSGTMEAAAKLNAAAAHPKVVQKGPSDDELINRAMSAAQAEREAMQQAGVGAARPAASYADAVRGVQQGAAAHDRATRDRVQHPEATRAEVKPALPDVERTVEGKPHAVPPTYVAPPSTASEDLLAALRAEVMAKGMVLPGVERPKN